MKPAPDEYDTPETIDEAVALLAQFAQRNSRALAGGKGLCQPPIL